MSEVNFLQILLTQVQVNRERRGRPPRHWRAFRYDHGLILSSSSSSSRPPPIRYDVGRLLQLRSGSYSESVKALVI